jgi:hypothetical protein
MLVLDGPLKALSSLAAEDEPEGDQQNGHQPGSCAHSMAAYDTAAPIGRAVAHCGPAGASISTLRGRTTAALDPSRAQAATAALG